MKIAAFSFEGAGTFAKDVPALAEAVKSSGAEIVLLEGIRLADVEEGVYILHAAPLNLGGAEGAPCRATLISPDL